MKPSRPRPPGRPKRCCKCCLGLCFTFAFLLATAGMRVMWRYNGCLSSLSVPMRVAFKCFCALVASYDTDAANCPTNHPFHFQNSGLELHRTFGLVRSTGTQGSQAGYHGVFKVRFASQVSQFTHKVRSHAGSSEVSRDVSMSSSRIPKHGFQRRFSGSQTGCNDFLIPSKAPKSGFQARPGS